MLFEGPSCEIMRFDSTYVVDAVQSAARNRKMLIISIDYFLSPFCCELCDACCELCDARCVMSNGCMTDVVVSWSSHKNLFSGMIRRTVLLVPLIPMMYNN